MRLTENQTKVLDVLDTGGCIPAGQYGNADYIYSDDRSDYFYVHRATMKSLLKNAFIYLRNNPVPMGSEYRITTVGHNVLWRLNANAECELCDTKLKLRRCRCSICVEEAPNGRVLCSDCANGYDNY